MNNKKIKKIFNLILCFIVCLGALLPCFFPATCKKTADAVLIYGDEIESSRTVLGTSKSDFSSSDLKFAFLNQAPYSLRTNEMLPGYSVTPETNNHNEIIGQTFFVNQFQIQENESIFMWIYLPDSPLDNYYSLTLSFNSANGGKIEWKYSFNQLISLMKNDFTQKYGWKLFELQYKDANKTSITNETVFVNFTITYNINLDDYKDAFKDIGEIVIDDSFYTEFVKTSAKLTFYNIFIGNNYSENSGIIFQLRYSYYGIKESFKQELNEIYLKDTYKVKKLNEMFDYVFAGKYNLLYTGVQNNNFSWIFSIQNSLGMVEVMTGESYTFRAEGINIFSITLREKRNGQITSLFNSENSFYCNEYRCGEFDNNYYNYKDTKQYVITFKLNDSFSLTGDINFYSSNDKVLQVESFEYSEESNLYYINIRCLKNGKANLKVSAYGCRDGFSKSDFDGSVDIIVTGITTSIFQSKFMIAIMILSILCIIVFFIITAINYRKAKRGY